MGTMKTFHTFNRTALQIQDFILWPHDSLNCTWYKTYYWFNFVSFLFVNKSLFIIYSWSIVSDWWNGSEAGEEA